MILNAALVLAGAVLTIGSSAVTGLKETVGGDNQLATETVSVLMLPSAAEQAFRVAEQDKKYGGVLAVH